MPSRKAHEKNRHGCQQCKARRVKCDLQLPVCGNCKRRLEPCFRDSDQILAKSPAAVAPPTTSRSSLPLLELELMHHFSTNVCQTLSDESVIQCLWQYDVPREALQHTHLMHAILALSALHLQYLSNDVQKEARYQEQATRHYELALSQVQPLVIKIDETNCGSVLAAVTLLGFFLSFQVQLAEGERVIEDFWFNHQLLRGALTIIEHAAEYCSKTRLSGIVRPVPWDNVLIPTSFQHSMDILRGNINTLGGDETSTQILHSAVQRLEENVRADIANPQQITISYMFLLAADRKYMALLTARNQMAWVIAAHYAVILCRQRHRWWMGDNGARFFHAVKGLLDAEFGALVEWLENFLQGRAEKQQLEALIYYF